MKTEPNETVVYVPLSSGESKGLTKREYFAAMSMQGIVSNPDEHTLGLSTRQAAELSVSYADALIEALNKK